VCICDEEPEVCKGFGVPMEWGKDPYSQAAEKIHNELLRVASFFMSGRLALEDIEARIQELLERGHTAAHLAGQQMSGYSPSVSKAIQAGHQAALGQNSYVRGLVTVLLSRDPHYWDADANQWRHESLASCFGSFVGRTRGTAYDGWVSATPNSRLYNWNLGVGEEDCEDCPDLAETGPWLANDTSQLQYPVLYTMPGDCETPCLITCTCTLSRVSDGVHGPPPFPLAK
jgi:hypothetical protein